MTITNASGGAPPEIDASSPPDTLAGSGGELAAADKLWALYVVLMGHAYGLRLCALFVDATVPLTLSRFQQLTHVGCPVPPRWGTRGMDGVYRMALARYLARHRSVNPSIIRSAMPELCDSIREQITSPIEACCANCTACTLDAVCESPGCSCECCQHLEAELAQIYTDYDLTEITEAIMFSGMVTAEQLRLFATAVVTGNVAIVDQAWLTRITTSVRPASDRTDMSSIRAVMRSASSVRRAEVARAARRLANEWDNAASVTGVAP